jgi:hypothetical protein
VDRVQVAADVTLHRQLEQERALFAQLGPEELRELLDDNQRLLDKARAMISGHFVSAAGATGPDVPATPGEIGTLPGDTCTDGDDA